MERVLRNALQKRMCRRQDMAHSPLHQAIFNTAEKRSKLFPDKRRIPGRKAKFIFAVWMLAQAWGFKKIAEVKRFHGRRDQDLKKLQRKAAPFLQATSDLAFIQAEERKNLLMQELFAHKSQAFLQRVTQRYNQEGIWAPFRHRYAYQYMETIRNPRPYFHSLATRYGQNFDLGNI